MNNTKLSPSLSVFISSNKLLTHQLMSDPSFLGDRGVKSRTYPIRASVQITAYQPSGLYLAVSVDRWAIQQRPRYVISRHGHVPDHAGREFQKELRQAVDDGVAGDFPDFEEWFAQNPDVGQL